MDSVFSKRTSTLDSKGEPLVAAMRTTVLQASCCHCMLVALVELRAPLALRHSHKTFVRAGQTFFLKGEKRSSDLLTCLDLHWARTSSRDKPYYCRLWFKLMLLNGICVAHRSTISNRRSCSSAAVNCCATD